MNLNTQNLPKILMLIDEINRENFPMKLFRMRRFMLKNNTRLSHANDRKQIILIVNKLSNGKLFDTVKSM